MPCVETEVYSHVLQKEKSLDSCGNFQYRISRKSVCMTESCKLTIKRPRGLIRRVGWFCKSFQLKVNLQCKLIGGYFKERDS